MTFHSGNGLVIQLKCECTGKTYSSLATLKAHKQTNVHLMWEYKNEVKNLEVRSTRLENENDNLKRMNVILIEKIKELQH